MGHGMALLVTLAAAASWLAMSGSAISPFVHLRSMPPLLDRLGQLLPWCSRRTRRRIAHMFFYNLYVSGLVISEIVPHIVVGGLVLAHRMPAPVLGFGALTVAPLVYKYASAYLSVMAASRTFPKHTAASSWA